MKTDDIVIYSKQHYEWLTQAGVWPKDLDRMALKGIVIESGDTIFVEWSGPMLYRHFHDGAWHPLSDPRLHHFADNLEVLTPEF